MTQLAAATLTIRASPEGIAGGMDVADLDAGRVLADAVNVRLDRPYMAWRRRPGSKVYNDPTEPLGNSS